MRVEKDGSYSNIALDKLLAGSSLSGRDKAFCSKLFYGVLENKLLPTDFDYTAIAGLRLEAQEKLNKIKPLNIGQASRISGVSPADISVLLIWLATNKNRE